LNGGGVDPDRSGLMPPPPFFVCLWCVWGVVVETPHFAFRRQTSLS